MPEYLIRANEGCAPDPFLLWDSVQQSIEDGTDFLCDWALAGPGTNTLNAGGLQAIDAIATAARLALWTDAYVPTNHPLFYLADGDNRGWWGDGVDVRTDLGEGPLGSFLWLLERAPLVIKGTPAQQWAQTFALQALAPLQQQGVVAKITCEAGVNTQNSRVWVRPKLYGSDGSLVYDRQWDLPWQQLS